MRGALEIRSGSAGLEVASQAEAEAGVNNTKAMTPLRVAEAVAALGGGGDFAGFEGVAFVNTASGDDGGGGGPEDPFASLQAAYAAGFRAFFLIGSDAGLTVGAPNQSIRLFGTGLNESYTAFIKTEGGGQITGNGKAMIKAGYVAIEPAAAAHGAAGGEWTAGENGGNGTDTPATTVRCLTAVTGISITGGRGGDGGNGFFGDAINDEKDGGDAGSAGRGGNPGTLTVIDCDVLSGPIVSAGGAGGNGGNGGGAYSSEGTPRHGGNGGAAGQGGDTGSIVARNCWCPGGTAYQPGSPGYDGGGGSGANGGPEGSYGPTAPPGEYIGHTKAYFCDFESGTQTGGGNTAEYWATVADGAFYVRPGQDPFV